jgi:hypothetical protein
VEYKNNPSAKIYEELGRLAVGVAHAIRKSVVDSWANGIRPSPDVAQACDESLASAPLAQDMSKAAEATPDKSKLVAPLTPADKATLVVPLTPPDKAKMIANPQ